MNDPERLAIRYQTPEMGLASSQHTQMRVSMGQTNTHDGLAIDNRLPGPFHNDK